jgi:hypothetical protein
MANEQVTLLAIRQVIKEELEPVKVEIVEIKKDIVELKNGQKKMQSDLKIVINTFDREYRSLDARVRKTEQYLGINSPDFQ